MKRQARATVREKGTVRPVPLSKPSVEPEYRLTPNLLANKNSGNIKQLSQFTEGANVSPVDFATGKPVIVDRSRRQPRIVYGVVNLTRASCITRMVSSTVQNSASGSRCRTKAVASSGEQAN